MGIDDDSVSSHLAQRQADEVSSIESIYGDLYRDITPKGLVWNRKPSPHFQIDLSCSDNPERPTLSLTLDIEFTSTYPKTAPIVKLLHPKNLLKSKIQELEDIIKQHIKANHDNETEEESAFPIISDVKEKLEDLQSTTEKVLSLEEERAQRLKKERLALESREAIQKQRKEVAKEIENKELNKQIQKIQGEYDPEISFNPEVSDTKERDMIPSDPENYFVFENPMSSELPGSRQKIKFKAVSGFISWFKKDLLSTISRQYVVKPYLQSNIQFKVDDSGVELAYLLTEIKLDNEYWNSDEGKSEIQDLEQELQLIINLNHDYLAKLLGFQIDKETSGWKVRLLNEFSSSADSLQDILITAEFINWGMARHWLIQLLPVLEYLHNSGVVHKSICPLAISIHSVELEDFTDDTSHDIESHSDSATSVKVLKVSHPSYAYRLMKMMEEHPNLGKPVKSLGLFTPNSWVAPELKSTNGSPQAKTDIWDLGVLFTQILLNVNILSTTYTTPDQFFESFAVEDFAGSEKYASSVYDLLCKMLQVKVTKRPTALELNAVQFLRDGPILEKVNLPNKIKQISEKSTHNSNLDNDIVDYQAVDDKRSLNPNTAANRRRYSNQNQSQESDFPLQSNNQNLGRYRRDFEEVGRLGKGGFGEVVKARNRIEGTFYAIKKIKHRANKLESLLSEVLSLARLNHQYIVRYYGAWFEEVRDFTESSLNTSASEDWTESESESDDEVGFFKGNNNSSVLEHNNSLQVDYMSSSFDPRIDFDELSDEDAGYEDDDDPFEFATSSCSDSNDAAVSTNSTISFKDCTKNLTSKSKSTRPAFKTGQQKSVLYIQMEFCENKTLLDLIQQGLPDNSNEYWRLFRQLLEAVSYIHREGFIHRDLKPMNIFMDKMNNIKVGDFGLAKNSQVSSITLSKNDSSLYSNKDFSTMVGTMFYSANEVHTGDYDEKVDMYALGVIFFEMCYTMSTGMERADILNKLRTEVVEFPSNFSDLKFKTQKRIIRLLLDHDPKARPSAAELLGSGWLPVEHQDLVIKAALQSLADPASPWQQQVRETLFNQPYSQAKDLIFDNHSKHTHTHYMNNSTNDYLIFSKMVSELFSIFQMHGAIEDFNTNSILPKAPGQAKERVYEVLDRSGSLLTLPYDLILPIARFLSRTDIGQSKCFRHEFVFRPSLKGSGTPDKFSTISFELTTPHSKDRSFDDAECLKVLDEIVQTFPCFHIKNAGALIVINHYDIVDAIILFAFRNIGIDEKKKLDILNLLSQLGIDKNSDEIKQFLREDFDVPYTVIRDLIDGFNITAEPEKIRLKLRKLMKDSALLVKVDRALQYISEVLKILRSLGVKTAIYLNPLSNYNHKYYMNGIMFQVLKKDKSRGFTRIATGGRFDSLIQSMTNKDLTKRCTSYAVGFTLSSTHMFLLMKALIDRRGTSDSNVSKWKGSRCDVLVNVNDDPAIIESGCEILKCLWGHNISCDKFVAASHDEIIQRANVDGANWIITIRQPKSQARKNKRQSKGYKPIKIRNLIANRDIDVEYDEIVNVLHGEINTTNVVDDSDEEGTGTTLGVSESNSSLQELSPLYSVDVSQKVIVVANEAPRGRKAQHRRDKWEIENDAKVASAGFIKTIAGSPIIAVDLRDEVLDMIAMTSIHLQDEWIRKVVYATKDLPKHFAIAIQNTLLKEYAKGSTMAILVSQKTHKTVLIDLSK